MVNKGNIFKSIILGFIKIYQSEYLIQLLSSLFIPANLILFFISTLDMHEAQFKNLNFFWIIKFVAFFLEACVNLPDHMDITQPKKHNTDLTQTLHNDNKTRVKNIGILWRIEKNCAEQKWEFWNSN